MFKYFISRVLFLFIASFFICWAYHTIMSKQLDNFFDVKIWDGYKFFIGAIILLIGVVVLNISFGILYKNEFKEYKNNSSYYSNELPIIRIIRFAFDYEKEREKYSTYLLTILCLVHFLYPMVIKGTPFVDNYCAYSGKLENGDQILSENIVSMDKEHLTEDKIRALIHDDFPESVRQDEFIFLESALIAGFKSNSYNKGFEAYIGCLPYYALEILIHILILIIIPYAIGVIILEKINEKNGKNEQIREIYKADITRENKAIIDTIIIIKKHQFDKEYHIQNTILNYENGLYSNKEATIINGKNWFYAHSLLFSLNNFSLLIPYAIESLNLKTYNIIKKNFDKYNFSSKYVQNPTEKAKEYLDLYEKDPKKGLKDLLDLIPETECDFNTSDLKKLYHIRHNYGFKTLVDIFKFIKPKDIFK